MEYRNLGRSGLVVSTLCLGGMTFGEKSERGIAEAEAIELIARFVDAGGNFIDTADAYGNGASERIIGQAISAYRDQVIIGSKVRFNPHARTPNDEGLSRRYIIRAVEETLRRLGTDYIDVYTMAGIDPLTPLEETLRALDELVRSGKVRYIGVTNHKAWQLVEFASVASREGLHPVVAAQYQYSLVCRDIEHEFLEIAERYGLGLTCWGPLGGGFLTGKYMSGSAKAAHASGRVTAAPAHAEEAWERRATPKNWRILELLEEIGARHEATVPQIALAWVLSRRCVASALVGARSPTQLTDVLGSVALKLTADELSALETVSEPEMPYPYRMIANYAMRALV